MKLPDGWYDGEIVVHDENGRPNFGLLQLAFDGSETHDIVYFLFDAPYLTATTCARCRSKCGARMLQALLEKAGSDAVRFSANSAPIRASWWRPPARWAWKGVIGKRRDSRYVTRRSPDWIKLKCGQRQEFVIGGYTDPQGSRTGIGALLLGYHDEDGVLQYAGNVGSGFNEASLRELKTRLDKLATDESPFPPKAVAGRKHHWVKPKLIAEVSFAEWTGSGSVRHAVFQGLRDDKPAKGDRARVGQTPGGKSAERSARQTARQPEGDNPERVIDAQSGATKIELVRYYALVGTLMMEHLKGRPVSLVRAPGGVGGELFFQKHADVGKLPGMKQMDPELDPDHPPMLEVGSVGGILSAAQWNVVEFHTQNAVGKAYETPNRMVFDLDPGEGVDWKAIQEAAQLMHAFLDELGLPAFLKTSGGKGLHVVVPIKGGLDWDTVKDFSQEIVRHLASTLPDRFRLQERAAQPGRGRSSSTTCATGAAPPRPAPGRRGCGRDWGFRCRWRGTSWTVKAGDQWNITMRTRGWTRAMSPGPTTPRARRPDRRDEEDGVQAGVLIHVPPARLEGTARRVHRLRELGVLILEDAANI
jgi:bifunctional non-homologous end joining protein LigD